MKKEIKVAHQIERTVSKTVSIELPSTPKYYSKNDESNFFARGEILFAIIPKSLNNDTSFFLLEIERNKQNFNDFVPTDDCKQSYWLSNRGIRHTALDILTGEDYEFKEIGEDEFNKKRYELLNHFKYQ